jgi:hypothetical protein
MRNAHCKTWNMAKKHKKVENETYAMEDLEYGKKQSKRVKMRNAHCRTRNMVINLENVKKKKNEKLISVLVRVLLL